MSRKRIRFGELKIGSKKIIVDKNKPLKFFVLEPFGISENRLNFYYIKLSYSLQENTNKIVWQELDGSENPHTKDSLRNYLKLTKEYYSPITSRLKHCGILMEVRIYGIVEYYLNPRYVFCGKEVPEFLLRMFDYDLNRVYGEHLFDLKNTSYEKAKETNAVDELEVKHNTIETLREI